MPLRRIGVRSTARRTSTVARQNAIDEALLGASADYQETFRALYDRARSELGDSATDHEVGQLMGRWTAEAVRVLSSEESWQPSVELLEAVDGAVDEAMTECCPCPRCEAERSRARS